MKILKKLFSFMLVVGILFGHSSKGTIFKEEIWKNVASFLETKDLNELFKACKETNQALHGLVIKACETIKKETIYRNKSYVDEMRMKIIKEIWEYYKKLGSDNDPFIPDTNEEDATEKENVAYVMLAIRRITPRCQWHALDLKAQQFGLKNRSCFPFPEEILKKIISFEELSNSKNLFFCNEQSMRILKDLLIKKGTLDISLPEKFDGNISRSIVESTSRKISRFISYLIEYFIEEKYFELKEVDIENILFKSNDKDKRAILELRDVLLSGVLHKIILHNQFMFGIINYFWDNQSSNNFFAQNQHLRISIVKFPNEINWEEYIFKITTKTGSDKEIFSDSAFLICFMDSNVISNGTPLLKKIKAYAEKNIRSADLIIQKSTIEYARQVKEISTKLLEVIENKENFDKHYPPMYLM